ncbi:hypothetical protein LEQ05_00560 [Riemerella anatipestifer]|nr:hypothetical protein LEQ05_00560 [Riemerella anatipestifer]
MKSKITLLTAAVLLLTTCNHYQLTQEDRALLKNTQKPTSLTTATRT